VKCEALLGLGYSITRDVNAACLDAIPDVPNAASPEEVLPVAEPPAAEAPAEPEPAVIETAPEPPAEEPTVVTTSDTEVGDTPEETAPAVPLLKPGDPGWRQTR